MFYPEDFADFALEKSFVPKVPFSLYWDVYEHGKLGISVNTSPIMALLLLFKPMEKLFISIFLGTE